MNHALDHLSRQWRLTPTDQLRIADHHRIEHCLDIAQALSSLLGDAATIHLWLRTPRATLYHATPLEVILGSARGRALLRAALLAEAAATCDGVALAALEAQS